MDKFSSIGQFRNVVKSVHYFCHEHGKPLPVFNYTGTVKLHGTNSGVRRTASGAIIPQSRNRILDLSCDNYEFAKFVNDNVVAFKSLFNTYFNTGEDVTIYGEWCGGGIQSGIALSQLDRHFVIFNARINGEYDDMRNIVPSLMDNGSGIYNIYQIPTYSVTIDFSDTSAVIHELNELTLEVERECPWGKFRGVSGVGEGIVWIPNDHPNISDLWFKTKGGKHSGKNNKKGIKASVSPEKAETITKCADIVLPEWRLQQGIEYLREMNFPIGYDSIGEYLKWVNKDVLKEELDTIEESGLEWKDINKVITTRARNFILMKIETEF